MARELIFKFSQPYAFEGKEYAEIDLSALLSFTVRHLIQAEKLYMTNGNIPLMSESTYEFACAAAHLASGLPIELFLSMPAPEGVALKNTLSGFFYGRG